MRVLNALVRVSAVAKDEHPEDELDRDVQIIAYLGDLDPIDGFVDAGGNPEEMKYSICGVVACARRLSIPQCDQQAASTNDDIGKNRVKRAAGRAGVRCVHLNASNSRMIEQIPHRSGIGVGRWLLGWRGDERVDEHV